MQISKKGEKIALISMELKTEETQPLTSMKQAAIWSNIFYLTDVLLQMFHILAENIDDLW